MAYIHEEGFENGTLGLFTAETDTAAILDFPHYTALAGNGMTPFRGAYCMRIRLNGGTTSAYVQEDTAFDDLIADAIRYLRFYFYLGRDFVMADLDSLTLVAFESVLDTTNEVVAGIHRDGTSLRFFYGETVASVNFVLGSTTEALGKWYSAELGINLDAGGGNDGTIDGYLNDRAGAQITALNQGVIVDAKFGVIGPDAGTSGTVLIDDITYSDTRLYARAERWPTTEVMTASGHVFIGPGAIDSASMLSNDAGDTIRLFDTDIANANDTQGFVVELSVNTSEIGQYHFKRGCYAQLTGTNARCQVVLSRQNGPQARDNGPIISYALQRKAKRYPS